MVSHLVTENWPYLFLWTTETHVDVFLFDEKSVFLLRSLSQVVLRTVYQSRGMYHRRY